MGAVLGRERRALLRRGRLIRHVALPLLCPCWGLLRSACLWWCSGQRKARGVPPGGCQRPCELLKWVPAHKNGQ